MDILKIKTLGDLKKSGYNSKSIKDELRGNLITALKNRTDPFKGIYGYDETVLPELQTSILSRHNILLLGLITLSVISRTTSTPFATAIKRPYVA